MGTYARQVDFLLTPQINPDTGSVYSSGYIKVLLAGTSTKATIYTARDKGSTATNPVALDADGTKEIYLDAVVDIEMWEGDPDSGGVKKDTFSGLEYLSGDPNTVATISDLADTDSSSGLTSVYVTGYSTAQDGGAGRFIWDSSDLSAQVTADTRKGLYVAPTGEDGSLGAWVRDYSGPINVLWFGCSKDGVTDDQAAFTAAYDMATYGATVADSGVTFGDYSYNGTAIYVPTGQYYVGATPWHIKHNAVTIYGDGASSVVLTNVGDEYPFIKIGTGTYSGTTGQITPVIAPTGTHIHDIYFAPNGPGPALYFVAANHTVLDRVFCRNNNSTTQISGGLLTERVQWLYLNDCWFTSFSDYAVLINALDTATGHVHINGGRYALQGLGGSAVAGTYKLRAIVGGIGYSDSGFAQISEVSISDAHFLLSTSDGLYTEDIAALRTLGYDNAVDLNADSTAGVFRPITLTGIMLEQPVYGISNYGNSHWHWVSGYCLANAKTITWFKNEVNFKGFLTIDDILINALKVGGGGYVFDWIGLEQKLGVLEFGSTSGISESNFMTGAQYWIFALPEYSNSNLKARQEVSGTVDLVYEQTVSGRTGLFTDGETITGGTSGATATVAGTPDGNNALMLVDVVGTFEAGGETVTGGTSGATATMTTPVQSDTVFAIDHGLLSAPAKWNVTMSAAVGITLKESNDAYLILESSATLTTETYIVNVATNQ